MSDDKGRKYSLGTENVGRLLWRLAIPAIVAQSVTAMYNLVDRLFIGQMLGRDAMAGLTLTFPYMLILASFGTLVGVGTGAMVSIRLGERRPDDAEKLLGQMVCLKVLFFVTIPVLAFIFLDETLMLLGGSAASIPYAREYMRIILVGNIFSHLAFGLSSIMRAEGNATQSMTCMIVGAVSNIILDALFVCVLKLGIGGAAWATNIAMFLSMMFALHHFSNHGGGIIKVRLKYIRLWRGMLGRVLAIGLSPFAMQLMASVIQTSFIKAFSIFAENQDLADLQTAAVGIVNGIGLFALMPVFGLSQGLQPIVGFNYGAGSLRRVRDSYVCGIRAATLLCTLAFGICMIFAGTLVSWFCREEMLAGISSRALRVSCLAYPFIGLNIMSTTYFQSIGHPHVAIVLSLLRQAIVLVPLVFILPIFMGVAGVWWAMPVSDFVSFAVTCVVVVFEFRRLARLQETQVLEQI